MSLLLLHLFQLISIQVPVETSMKLWHVYRKRHYERLLPREVRQHAVWQLDIRVRVQYCCPHRRM